MITVKELEQKANAFLKENYNMSLKVPLKLNGRLSSTLGRFRLERIQGVLYSSSIELSKKLVEYYERHEVVDVLYHELVHYALFELGLPCDDGHPYFENELAKHNVTSTGHYRHKGKGYIYGCTVCEELYTQRRKIRKGYCIKCDCGNLVRANNLVSTTIIK